MGAQSDWRVVLPKPPFDPGVVSGKGKDARRVCSCFGSRGAAEEHARLIAAAPELLEALQDLFGADMEHVLMGDGKDDQIEAIAKARAAIAKATGGST